MTSYNLASGHEAWYTISPAGSVLVSVRSNLPLRPRGVFVGTASLTFRWVSSGHSAHWQFSPTLIDPTPSLLSETTDASQRQIINVELGHRLFPATGLVKPNMSGEIKAPAVHFDLPYTSDLWVFILRSPWVPPRIDIEKEMLSIQHDSMNVNVQLQSRGGLENEDELRMYVSTQGEGLKNVQIILQRSMQYARNEQTIAAITSGMENPTWKPLRREFDLALVANTNTNINAFIEFLRFLGADAKPSFLASYMPNDFLLCDGAGIDYTLKLKGEKRFLGHEEDETKIALTY